MSTPRLKSFPLGWVTTGRTVLLVGGCGGELCRLRQALAFDWARIRVAVPPGQPELCADCVSDSRVTVSGRPPDEEDIRDAHVVIESTTDRTLAETLAGWCRAHQVPLNAMDKPDLCDLHYPALFLREPLVISIASGGDAPALSALLRRWLGDRLGPGWSTAARLLADLRQRLPAGQSRMDVLKNIAARPGFLACIEADDEAAMKRLIEDALHRMRTGTADS